MIQIARKYILQNRDSKGVRSTWQELKNRGVHLSQRKIGELKKEIQSSYHASNFNYLNKKVVFPYIGGWFFDIVDNRGRVQPNEEKTKGWAVFCHGNSGYVVAFPISFKNKENLTKVYKEFRDRCKHLPVLVYTDSKGRHHETPKVVEVEYPVKFIASDQEKGWGKNFDIGTYKVNAGENHRFLSRINAFASQLRKRYYTNSGNKQRSITNEEFEDFVNDWNLTYLDFNGTTRGEMLADKNLELAYIARALYYNEDRSKDKAEAIKDEDVVKIREPDKKPFSPTKQGQVLTGKYQVVQKDGDQLVLQNINDETDQRTVHYNDVVGKYQGARDYFKQQHEATKDVEVPRLADKVGTNVYQFEEIPTEIKEKVKVPVNKERLAKQMVYNKNYQEEQYGFPSEWRPEEIYKMMQRMKEILDQDSYNYIIGMDNTAKKRLSKRVRETLEKRGQEQMLSSYMPNLGGQYVPRTNAYDSSPELLNALNHPFIRNHLNYIRNGRYS